MTEMERIAAGLTKAQREAILSAVEVQVGHYPARWEVTRPRVWTTLIAKQLAYGGAAILSFGRRKNDRAILNKTGLAARAT